MSKHHIKRQNRNNKLICKDDVEGIMKQCGINLDVNNIEIYRKAFIHRSYLKTPHIIENNDTCVPLQESCNETYEFLGDTILNSVVGTYLYDRYHDENEGFLTKTRTKMVRGTTLGELAQRLDFGKWVIISQHVESEGGRENLRILEDLFEAFIAAIYLDNGSEPISNEWFAERTKYSEIEHTLNQMEQQRIFDKSEYIRLSKQLRNITNRMMTARSNGYLYCQKFIMNTYEKHIDISKLIKYDDNYKDQLQTHFQKINDIFPKWEVLKEEGKTNQRWHTIGVRDRCGFIIGTGRERKKTDAEQLASKNALIYMGVISDDHGTDFFKKNINYLP